VSEISVPVSFGELLDKIAILQIKSERMSDESKLANVRRELQALERTWMASAAARWTSPGCARNSRRSTSACGRSRTTSA
jgi:hypothetical protein